MWTEEEIVQQPTPHTERKTLLMRSDRRHMTIFLFPHVAVKNPIFCECVLIGNKHIADEMWVDGSLVDVPPTKTERRG
jgi:hypothetical protein